MLVCPECEGTGFLRLARAYMEKEKKLQSMRGATPTTWEKSGACLALPWPHRNCTMHVVGKEDRQSGVFSSIIDVYFTYV